jgi:hypothetical protein
MKIVSNVMEEVVTDPEKMGELLIQQIVSLVHW